MTTYGNIRTGIGGWVFDAWNESFYPPKLPKTKQLQHAGSKLRAIEINGTYYGSQKPATFAKWAADVPDGFVFSLKASRYCTNRKVLSEGGASVEKFLTQGITELGDRLGPILWQFMATKAYDPEDFEGFLKLLPKEQDGLPLRHVVEPRHDSFRSPEFIELIRNYGVAAVVADVADGVTGLGGSQLRQQPRDSRRRVEFASFLARARGKLADKIFVSIAQYI